MYVRNIQPGTPFTVTLEENEAELEAIFEKSIDHIKFYINNAKLYESIGSIGNSFAKARFVHDNKNYTFRLQILNKASLNIVECVAVSSFNETDRREYFRMNFSIKVTLRSYDTNQKNLFDGDMLCEGVSSDISKTGMRLLTDYNSKIPVNTNVVVEFSLMPYGSNYHIPARVVRNQDGTAVKTHLHGYGLAFDFTNCQDAQDKLLTQIMEAKVRGHF